jgi:ABC-2 type transport system permease protein
MVAGALAELRRLIAGEVGKLFTTRLWLWLLLASVALTSLYATLSIAFGDDPDNPTPPLSSPGGQRTLFSVAQGAGSLVAVLGAIGLTAEFRHRTATGTFLATPHRGRVVLAKLVVYLVAGAGYALVCIAATIAIALPWLAAKGIDVSLVGNGIPGTLAGVVAVLAVFCMLGVGVGALLRNQIAAVVGLLVYLFVVEPVVSAFPALSDATRYLPGSAGAALTGVAQAGIEYVPPWLGGLLLAGYSVAFAVAGTFLAMRRDVT